MRNSFNPPMNVEGWSFQYQINVGYVCQKVILWYMSCEAIVPGETRTCSTWIPSKFCWVGFEEWPKAQCKSEGPREQAWWWPIQGSVGTRDLWPWCNRGCCQGPLTSPGHWPEQLPNCGSDCKPDSHLSDSNFLHQRVVMTLSVSYHSPILVPETMWHDILMKIQWTPALA